MMGCVATYTVNPEAVAHAERLIRGRQYVLDSDWGEVQPRADAENAFLEKHAGRSTPPGTSGSPRVRTTRPRRATRSCTATCAGSTAPA